jgi:tetratricopeptide (TPR) repeat protein
LELIKIAMKQGSHAMARDWAIRGLAASPSNVSLLLARGKAERALENLDMAKELALAALAEDPNSLGAYELITSVALDSHEARARAEAIALLNEAISKRPGSDRLQRMSALLLAADGKTDKAIQHLEAYVRTEHGKQSLKGFLTLAELCHAKGDRVGSGKWVDRASALAPDNPAVARARVVLLGAQKKYDDIVELISARKEKRPGEIPLMITAAATLASAGSKPYLQEAMGLFDRVITLAPHIVEAHLGLAVLAYQTGDVERAESTYRRLLELDPDNPEALNGLAWVLTDARSDHTAALEMAEKAVRLAPGRRSLRDTRGVILSNLPGRLEEARLDFEKCLALAKSNTPGQAKAHFRLAGVCVRLKAYAQAEEHLDETLRIDRAHGVLTPKERSEIDRIASMLREVKAARPG